MVQGIHAVYESLRNSPGGELRDSPHPHLILCHSNNESTLEEAMNSLQRSGESVYPFIEPDMGSELTAIASSIVTNRRPYRKFKLLKIKTGEKEMKEMTQEQSQEVSQAPQAPQESMLKFGEKRSRWGFHTVSYDTYSQLREMSKDIWKDYLKLRRWGKSGKRELHNRNPPIALTGDEFDDSFWVKDSNVKEFNQNGEYLATEIRSGMSSLMVQRDRGRDGQIYSFWVRESAKTDSSAIKRFQLSYTVKGILSLYYTAKIPFPSEEEAENALQDLRGKLEIHKNFDEGFIDTLYANWLKWKNSIIDSEV